jgi:hypothetical protein
MSETEISNASMRGMYPLFARAVSIWILTAIFAPVCLIVVVTFTTGEPNESAMQALFLLAIISIVGSVPALPALWTAFALLEKTSASLLSKQIMMTIAAAAIAATLLIGFEYFFLGFDMSAGIVPPYAFASGLVTFLMTRNYPVKLQNNTDEESKN